MKYYYSLKKMQAWVGFEPMTYQLSYQANWQLATFRACNKPLEGEELLSLRELKKAPNKLCLQQFYIGLN